MLNFGEEVGFITDSKPQRDSISVYGQVTYNLSGRLRLVAGLRYTKDEVYSEVTNFFGRAGTAILDIKNEKLTGRGVVEFDLNDDTMVYASYTRGFKPGGSNLTYGREDVIAPIVVLPTFKDETVDAWELGIKTDFADNRVRLNAAAFYYEYKNLQYQATDPELFEGGVVNLMLSIAPDAYPWHIDLMGMNLADEDGINSRFTDVFGVGATGDELIAPRQYMVRLGVEF